MKRRISLNRNNESISNPLSPKCSSGYLQALGEYIP